MNFNFLKTKKALTKSEKLLLKYFNTNKDSHNSCLVDLLSLTKIIKNSDENIENILSELENKDYLEMVKTKYKDEYFVCVTLRYKGRNYTEENQKDIKNVKLKIAVTIFCAVLSFLIGRILFIIFN